MGTTRIGRLEPGDLERFYAFRLHALAADPDAFLRTHDEELARGPSQCARVLNDREHNAVFAAFATGAVGDAGDAGDAGETLVGMVGLYRESPVKWRHKAGVWGMFVDASARGLGLGGALLDHAIAFARTMPGLLQLHLSAEATHAAAIALYVSRGFVAWGTEPRGTLDGARAMDEVHYVLRLDAPST